MRGNRFSAPPDEKAMREAASISAGYDDFLAQYNRITGETRSMGSLKHFAFILKITPRWRRKPGPAPGKARNGYVGPPDESREVQGRVQRLALYRDAHGIVGALSDSQITEAIEGDPDDWPDGPPIPVKPLDCSGQSRPGRIYRTSLPRRRTGRAS